MTILHLLLPVLAILIGIAKASAERVVDFFSWNNSIFASKYPSNVTVDDLRKESPKFTHPREVSWKRKHTGPRWLQKLKSTVLVGTTDLWHFGDTVTALIAFIGIPLTVFFVDWTNLPQLVILLVGSWVAYAFTFHLFYHKFLYVDANAKLLDKDQITK
jgi:hypothetical protein